MGESYEEAYRRSLVEGVLGTENKFDPRAVNNTRLTTEQNKANAAFRSEQQEIRNSLLSPDTIRAEHNRINERVMTAQEIAQAQVKESMRILEQEKTRSENQATRDNNHNTPKEKELTLQAAAAPGTKNAGVGGGDECSCAACIVQ